MKKIWHIIKQSALSMNILAPQRSDELCAVRQRFLRYLLYISIFASFPAMLIATKEALAMGDRFSPAFYLGLFISVLCITVFQNRIGFAWKTIVFISAFFALAIHNLLCFGFSGAGIHILLIVSVLMTVLLGQLAGSLTLMAGLAAIICVGVAMSTGVTSVGFDLNYLSGQMISWMTAAGVFVLLAGAGVLIPGKLQDELGQSLEKRKIQSDQLSRANQELENEVARRKQVENELRLQALVLDQIQDRVTLTDMEGSLSYINEAEKQALGYARTPLCQASVTFFGKEGDLDATMLQILENAGAGTLARPDSKSHPRRTGEFFGLPDPGGLRAAGRSGLQCALSQLISLRRCGWKTNSTRPKKWNPWGVWQAVWHIISTTSLPLSTDMPKWLLT